MKKLLFFLFTLVVLASGCGKKNTFGGLHTSENAGMSSENYVRIIMAESLRFLEEGCNEPYLCCENCKAD